MFYVLLNSKLTGFADGSRSTINGATNLEETKRLRKLAKTT